MSEKVIHGFEGICPLTHYGIYGIKKRYRKNSIFENKMFTLFKF